MDERDDEHLRLLFPRGSKSERREILYNPVIGVFLVDKGPDRGKFSLLAHGLNDMGERTMIEVCIRETFEDAAIVLLKIKGGRIRAEDAQEYEVTKRDRLTLREKLHKIRP